MKFVSKKGTVIKSGDSLMTKKVKKPAKKPEPIVKEGVFCGTTRGFGFVQIEGEEDIFGFVLINKKRVEILFLRGVQ